MTKILITTNPESELFSEIDFTKSEWSTLCIDNLSPFKMEELRRPCSAYSDGIFPGASMYENNKQISRIQKFSNYIEFSKIVSDEVVPISGQLYLTTKFYDRRKEGWSALENKKKEGEVMGYCINGDVYSIADKAQVYKVFYGIVYRSLVSKNPAFIKLQQMLKDGISLCLVGADEDFMLNLKNVLLDNFK